MKYFKKLVGERIYLSPMSIEDAEKYVEWLSDFKVTDGLGRSTSLMTIEDEKPFKLNIARVITVLMGFIAAWGVRVFITALGGSIFNFVYVFIVLQLSLLGSIIVGLMSKKENTKYMSLSIILALTLGFGLSIIGTIMGKTELIDVAGTVAAISSIIIAIIINSLTYKIKDKEE